VPSSCRAAPPCTLAARSALQKPHSRRYTAGGSPPVAASCLSALRASRSCFLLCALPQSGKRRARRTQRRPNADALSSELNSGSRTFENQTVSSRHTYRCRRATSLTSTRGHIRKNEIHNQLCETVIGDHATLCVKPKHRSAPRYVCHVLILPGGDPEIGGT